MAGLVFKDICKIYPGNVEAVNNFNLDIKDQEFIVLVGPSGCGKSTILRMVAGLEEVSAGELYIDNILVNNRPPKERNIAMVFQDYALYPHMSVYDNMAFCLKLKKMPKSEIKHKVDQSARILGIEDLLHRKPKALSGGQRQRVALGRAIVREPQVFLMDEPLSNLDAKLRVQTRTEIIKLHQKLKSTFIYVTHDQTEAMTMGDRMVVMNNGKIQQIGSPLEVYSTPSNAFVAGFIGSPQMNFFDGIIKPGDSDCLELVFSDIRIKLSRDKSNLLHNKGYLHKSILVGIRPEDICETSISASPHLSTEIEVKVEVLEMTGAESYLYFNISGNNAAARVSSNFTAKTGSMVKLSVKQDKLHLFDLKSEERI